MAGVDHQDVARQLLGLAVDLDREQVLVRDLLVDVLERRRAVGVLEVDDLLFGLGQRVLAEVAHLLEEVAPAAGALHQPGGLGVGQLLPPEREEHRLVRGAGHHVVDARAQRLRDLILRVGRKAQRRIRTDAVGIPQHLFIGVEQIGEGLGREGRLELGAPALKRLDVLVERLEGGVDRLGRIVGHEGLQ